jgi:hypothetical protein
MLLASIWAPEIIGAQKIGGANGFGASLSGALAHN